ncbi:MAG: ABC transporter substrate-binding protein, partial [Phormidesmis sp.]
IGGGSSGRSIFAARTVSTAKQNGLDALAKKDYATAQAEFEASLKADRNDPESLIYLNNAKIGDSSAYSMAVSVPAGNAVNPALEILRGVAQAQTDINEAGGISGTPLKVLIFNDDGDPSVAAKVAAELVADSAVLGVVGHYTSDTTLGAASVYEAGKLPMISPTSTAVKIAEAGDYIFRTVPSDRLASATIARYTLNSLNKTKAVVFYNGNSTYSLSVKSEFTQELLSGGGEVVASFDSTESGFNAGQALQQAKDAGAEVIMLDLTTDTVETSFDIINANDQELPLIGNDDLYDPRILKESGAKAKGLTVAVPWHILSHLQSPFVAESRRLWGGDVSWRTVMAYDATEAFAAAIAQDPTREGVEAALSASGFSAQGATNTVSFFPSGDRNQPSQLVTIVPGKAAGADYTYEPVQ